MNDKIKPLSIKEMLFIAFSIMMVVLILLTSFNKGPFKKTVDSNIKTDSVNLEVKEGEVKTRIKK